MITSRIKPILLVFGFILFVFSGEKLYAAGENHELWTKLLSTHVKNGVVDYQGFKKDEALLDEYLQYLDENNPYTLSESEQFAFFVNSYNAYTVKLILKNFKDDAPPASIKKIGGFFSGPWSIKFVKVGGKVYTLDNIEHDILRPLFKESRVHFAINCASKSCPHLLSEAFVGGKIEAQLQQVTSSFLSDNNSNYFSKNTLYVSKIFSWFKEDFPQGVVPFFKEHGKGDIVEKLNQVGEDVKVSYLDYDWSLNGN